MPTDHSTPASKRCNTCKRSKPATPEFFNRLYVAPDGLQRRCRTCSRAANRASLERNRQEVYRRAKVRRLADPARFREYARRSKASGARSRQGRALHLRKKYGLTPEAYDAMLVRQGGVCAICGGPPDGRWKRFHVDHCHKTGRVRGLLCRKCNNGLGNFGDSVETMRKAIAYLRRKR